MLVGHQISSELDIMEKIGINLRDQELFSIEGILDISTISKYLGLPFSRRPSLGRLLEFFRIPFQESYFHNAGNDPHFTLRALLMLAAMAFEHREVEDFTRARMSDLRSIALDLIDFDSRTPDAERLRLEKNAKKAAWCALERESVIKLADDWWDGSEKGFLGMAFFEMDGDT